jgi:hypothetical protein
MLLFSIELSADCDTSCLGSDVLPVSTFSYTVANYYSLKCSSMPINQLKLHSLQKAEHKAITSFSNEEIGKK